MSFSLGLKVACVPLTSLEYFTGQNNVKRGPEFQSKLKTLHFDLN